MTKIMKSEHGTTLDLYFNELYHFCHNQDSITFMLKNGAEDFFRYVVNKNTRRKVWLQGFFEASMRILKSSILTQV